VRYSNSAHWAVARRLMHILSKAPAAMSGVGHISARRSDRSLLLRSPQSVTTKCQHPQAAKGLSVTLSPSVSATALSSDSCFGRDLPAVTVCQAG